MHYKQGGIVPIYVGQETSTRRKALFRYELPKGNEIIGLKCSNSWGLGLHSLSLITWSKPLRSMNSY